MTATLTVPDISAEAFPLPEPGRKIKLGSEAHKRLFCRTLLDTFDPYRPAMLDWPKLSEEARARLIKLPIWDVAVQTEGKAGLRVQTYADRIVTDPLLKKATDLNAYEEKRHKLVLACLVEAYGIRLAPEPAYKVPKDAEWAFMVTGFSECIDSFFAFGLFEMAKRSGFFPPALVDTFEPVMREEGRHITFFANWVAWHRRNMPLWRRPWFELKQMAVWVFLAFERIGIAGGVGGAEIPRDDNFTLTGSRHLGLDLSLSGLMDVCLAENDRRLAPYDARLLRPMFVPRMVRLARGVTRVLTGR